MKKHTGTGTKPARVLLEHAVHLIDDLQELVKCAEALPTGDPGTRRQYRKTSALAFSDRPKPGDGSPRSTPARRQ